MKVRDIAHSRAGDKGDTSNVSVIAFDPKDYALLRDAAGELARCNGIEDGGRGCRNQFIVLAQLQRQEQVPLALEEPLLMIRLGLPEWLQLFDGCARPWAEGDCSVSRCPLSIVVRKDYRRVLPRAPTSDVVVSSEKCVENALVREDARVEL